MLDEYGYDTSIINGPGDVYMGEVLELIRPEVEKCDPEEIKQLIANYNKQFQAEVDKQIGHKSVIISNDVDIEKIKQYRERIELAKEQQSDQEISH